jgi:hypothetical protein
VQPLGSSQHFMEPEGSLPSSQELPTRTYPEPDQSSPQHSILSLKGRYWAAAYFIFKFPWIGPIRAVIRPLVLHSSPGQDVYPDRMSGVPFRSSRHSESVPQQGPDWYLLNRANLWLANHAYVRGPSGSHGSHALSTSTWSASVVETTPGNVIGLSPANTPLTL